jgi:GNAT superfamily N-acetyltransferase
MKSILIHFAENDSDILRCLPILVELRPHLSAETFLPTIRQMQRNGYHLVMLEVGGRVVAVAGYRFAEHLARGNFVYVDDLVTAAAFRRKGYGKQLFDWLVEMAQSAGSQELHLDSGLQRKEAHAFYEERKMIFSSRHYSLKLNTA